MPLTATLQIMPEDAPVTAEVRADRRVIATGSTLRLTPGFAYDVTVEDLSMTGCLLRSSLSLPLGTHFRLGLRGNGSVEGEVVRIAPHGYGCTFIEPIPADMFAKAFDAQDSVHTMFPDRVAAPVGDPEIARWPRPVRAGVIIGCALAAWGAVGAVLGWI